MRESIQRGTLVFAGTATQSAANTDTWVQIPTGVDPGTGTVLEFLSLEVYWRNFAACFSVSVGQVLEVGFGRAPNVPSLANVDQFGMVAWAWDHTAATAAWADIDPIMGVNLQPGQTLQPYVYVGIHTANLLVAAQVDYRITYETTTIKGDALYRAIAGNV